jgi:small subunit ribosomal protein S1
VTFGAFVEIMDGVEGLVHISELAHHHVENPREVVEPGDTVKVKILEIDSDRRRLSLSVKRVAGNEPPPGTVPSGGGGGTDLGEVRDLGLSDDVFAGPDVSGLGDLRATVEAQAAEREAEDAPVPNVDDVPEEESAVGSRQSAEAASEDEAPPAEVDEPAADAAPDEPAADAAPDEAADATSDEAAADEAPVEQPAEADAKEPGEADESGESPGA